MHKLNQSQLRTVKNSRTFIYAMANGARAAHKLVTYNETLSLTHLQIITRDLTLYSWLMGPRGKIVESQVQQIDQDTFDKIAQASPEGLS